METTNELAASGGDQDDHRDVVLVTGSSGMIGTNIIKRLLKDYQVVGLDKMGNPYPPKEAEWICFDLTSEESIRAAMERVRYAYGSKIASVIHLAAYYDFSGEPSPLYEKVTIQGTENFVKVLQDFEVEQFVFSSTNLIYKPTTPGIRINEDCPLEPNWNYPESKMNTEEIIREKRGNMHAVLLRLAGVYDDIGHSIPVSHQIQRIYEKQLTSHFYSGDTSHGNVFLHMEDLLDALEKTVENRKTLAEEIAINIGEAETPTYEELQKTIGRLVHGEDWETFEMPKPLAKAGAWGMDLVGDPFIKPWMISRADDHYELDISRAKELLNWEPKHRLIDTLPYMIQELKADPLKWYRMNKIEPPERLQKEQTQQK
ncbi:nucleoside-diphosphate-sugar epimerase [Catalinimonas alkaloidigena]|uniref:NAD-dependent epimerase/dehydratase family protein n=1 Tax=Catalinimonas alkaloidigena TaxID=1075417 RepID=UPI0024068872|nr:NAD(P)-dependent oxidoreductase [Catalinimonas alkaloidigena]MDF9798399.1 nucleoside-diphosphate-sugar epimerase [Catalinimonas alkaloidigena]